MKALPKKGQDKKDRDLLKESLVRVLVIASVAGHGPTTRMG